MNTPLTLLIPRVGLIAALTRLACVLPLMAMLAACSADAQRLNGLTGDPALCRPGTFIGSMTGNCPQRVR